MRLFWSLCLAELSYAERLSEKDGIENCEKERDICIERLETSDDNYQSKNISYDSTSISDDQEVCSGHKSLINNSAIKCVLCLLNECSFDNNSTFPFGDKENATCSFVATINRSLQISGANGTCDFCNEKYDLYKMEHLIWEFDIKTTKMIYKSENKTDPINLSFICELTRISSGKYGVNYKHGIKYGVNEANCARDEENCKRKLYVTNAVTGVTMTFLDVDIDPKIFIGIMIMFSTFFVALLMCLFSHTPFMIENLVCHKNFSCYRWSNWICACCPRSFLDSSCSTCRKKNPDKYERLQYHDSSHFGSSRATSHRSRMLSYNESTA